VNPRYPLPGPPTYEEADRELAARAFVNAAADSAIRVALGTLAKKRECAACGITFVGFSDLDVLCHVDVGRPRYEGVDAEPCWRCGGGGSYCEERLGDLETCRCCGGTGEHCQTVAEISVNSAHAIACVKHNPKQRPDECQLAPEIS